MATDGADGGAKIAASSANGKTWGGGQGATVSATFKIGTGSGEIPSGSTIRFLVGGKGGSIKSGGNAGGGGGYTGGRGYVAASRQLNDYW